MIKWRALWVVLTWLWLCGQAAAAPEGETATPAPPAARVSEDELVLALEGGPFWSKHDVGGLGGLAGYLRHRFVEVGVAVSYVGTHSDNTRAMSEALRLGLGWQSDFGLRLDLLGVIGLDAYHSRPSGMDPGTQTFLGFGGVHAGAWYGFGRPGNGSRFLVGLIGMYESDFVRSAKHYTYADESGAEVFSQYRFGSERLGVLLSLGASIDIDLHL